MTSPNATAGVGTGGCAVVPAGVPACSTIYTYFQDDPPIDPPIKDLSGHTRAGGWLQGVTDPYGHVVAYAYDAAGNIARTWDCDATAGHPVTDFPGTLAAPTNCLYTETLRNVGGTAGVLSPCSSTTPAAAVSTPGRYVRSTRDPLGNLATFGVDANGNRASTTPPRGNVAGNTTNYTTT